MDLQITENCKYNECCEGKVQATERAEDWLVKKGFLEKVTFEGKDGSALTSRKG